MLDARYRRHTISGRAAIALALQVIGVKRGDRVLVPTYHCPTMIAPVVQAQATPVFYPITASGGPNLDWLHGAAAGAGASAMLTAHYFGLPQPMSALRSFCDGRRIALIEDCAHAFFGASDGRPVGHWGNVAIASLTKFFPVPEGGMLVSSTVTLDKLSLAPRGWIDELRAAADAVEIGVQYDGFTGLNSLLRTVFNVKNRLRQRTESPIDDRPLGNDSPDTTSGRLLSSLQSAVAARWIVSSVHSGRIGEIRRRNYAHLAGRLSNVRGARPLFPELPEKTVPYVFPLYVDDPAKSYQPLRAAGVPIFRWDEVWPQTPSLTGDHGLDWSTHVFQLGCHQDLTQAQVDAVADTVRSIVEGSRV